jgi:plasmid stabilization system protein ParE
MIVYLPGALRDLRRIARWYQKRRPAYESRFFERLRATIERVESAPASFPVMLADAELRRARVLRSPYFVAFLAFEGMVHVVAVVHGARKPGTISRQLRERNRAR